MRRRSLLTSILDAVSSDALRAPLAMLRDLERAHPYIGHFDERTIPSRNDGELVTAWRKRQLDVLQAHVRRVLADVERMRASAALTLTTMKAAVPS